MENQLDNKYDVIFDFAKKSFEDIISEVTEETIEPVEKFEMKSDNMLSIIIGISGETSGRILLNTTAEYGNNLAKIMNFGDELEKEDDLFLYLAEFSNMFCGRAATYINNKFGKREVWITPPAIFSAKDLDIVTPNVSSNEAYYKCSFGNFVIDVGFSENMYDEF